MKKPTKLPFKGTPEQEKQLREAIALAKANHEGTMSVLQHAQAIYGYLPIEVQQIVADELGVSLSEVYGIATFYAQFTLEPKAENVIGVCLGTACYVKGSGQILEEVKSQLGIDVGESTDDGKFSLSATRCLGACGLAPVMTVNDEVYGKLTKDMVKDILGTYSK